MTDNADRRPPRPDGDIRTASGGVEVVEAAQLLRGASEIVIHHAGQNYRLRITRANKLLLIK